MIDGVSTHTYEYASATPKMAIENTCAHNVSVFQMGSIRILDFIRRNILFFLATALFLLATVSLYGKNKTLFATIDLSNDDLCLILRKQFSILQIMRRRFRTQKKSNFLVRLS